MSGKRGRPVVRFEALVAEGRFDWRNPRHRRAVVAFDVDSEQGVVDELAARSPWDSPEQVARVLRRFQIAIEVGERSVTPSLGRWLSGLVEGVEGA